MPLVGIISRLADQKGFDLIAQVINDVLSLDIQFVVLGTGEKKYHELLQTVQTNYPQKLGLYLGFSDELAHQIEAGSDMFLMPSRYEPCGLNQMYSLKYGTVPIVRATGGLADTIKEFDPISGMGNGFVFSTYESRELFKSIDRAILAYQDQNLWKKIMKNGMSQDFSWKTSAGKYADLYARLLNR